MANWKTIEVNVPKHDCDVVINFPGDEQIIIQLRPSNADLDYNGSLDVILPNNQKVTAFEGDDLTPAKGLKRAPHTRIAKQLVTELPGNYNTDTELD